MISHGDGAELRVGSWPTPNSEGQAAARTTAKDLHALETYRLANERERLWKTSHLLRACAHG